MSRLTLLVAVLLVLQLKTVQSKNVYIPSEAQEIIHFCQENGKDFLTVTTKDLDDVKVCSITKTIVRYIRWLSSYKRRYDVSINILISIGIVGRKWDYGLIEAPS